MTETRDISDTLLDRLGRFLARRLHSPNPGYEPYTPSDPETLSRTLEPGDILLNHRAVTLVMIVLFRGAGPKLPELVIAVSLTSAAVAVFG